MRRSMADLAHRAKPDTRNPLCDGTAPGGVRPARNRAGLGDITHLFLSGCFRKYENTKSSRRPRPTAEQQSIPHGQESDMSAPTVQSFVGSSSRPDRNRRKRIAHQRRLLDCVGSHFSFSRTPRILHLESRVAVNNERATHPTAIILPNEHPLR
jgi:hypothetical protein